MKLIRTHKDLEVFQLAFEAAIKIFELSKSFPKDERFSLTDQIRRSSRSVAANIAEAFRKRRYEKAFVAKLSDSEGEAVYPVKLFHNRFHNYLTGAETQVWIAFAYKCSYINNTIKEKLDQEYDHIIGKIVNMIIHLEKWSF